MDLRRTIRRRTGGFTLLELLIAVGVLGLVLSAVGLVQLRGNDASASMQARDNTETRARRTLDRVAEELTGVGKTLMFPDPNTNQGAGAITYQRSAGVNNLGVEQWGPTSRLELQMDPNEIDNGLDDDSDGLVDERQLLLTRNFAGGGSQVVVLCTGIPELAPGETANNNLDDDGNGVTDEAGFNVRRVGDLLTVRLCVQAPFAGNQVTTTRLQTSVVLHN